MKPFTLEWWFVWKEYAHDMYSAFSDLTDEIITGDRDFAESEVQWAWDKYQHYRKLNKWIRERIINKYED